MQTIYKQITIFAPIHTTELKIPYLSWRGYCKEIFGEDHYSFDKTVYTRSQNKVTLFCNRIGGNGKPHGYFDIIAGNILRGKGCPICGNHRSDAEDEIFKYAVSIVGEGKVFRSDRSLLGDMELDVYVPEKKFAGEFIGAS